MRCQTAHRGLTEIERDCCTERERGGLACQRVGPRSRCERVIVLNAGVCPGNRIRSRIGRERIGASEAGCRARQGITACTSGQPTRGHAGPELVDTHFREAFRVLAEGGELAILNFSYRDDIAADRRDFERLCRAWGFEVLAAAQRPFKMWDGIAFRARKRDMLRSQP